MNSIIPSIPAYNVSTKQPRSRLHRGRHLATALVGCGALLALSPAITVGTPASISAASRTRAVRTLHDTAKLHRVHCSCNAILEKGRAKGSLPGSVLAYVNVGAPIVFHFTIKVRGGGSLSGRGSGKPKGNPAEPSFAGHVIVTRGTGRYRHAHGKGGFYGTINRSTDAAVMQTTGTLSY
jgi:hypothetical protein